MLKLAVFGLTTFLILGCSSSETTDKCIEEAQQEECSDTEYHSYVECIRKRTKRSADCDNECNDCDGNSGECSDCDCNYCSYNDCSNTCNSCCEQAPAPCATRSCCHQTCNSQCRTVSCRRRCRSRCQTKIDRAPSGESRTNITTALKAEAKHNITTIINLHNVINNTNIIDMPINLNNTNINNITVEAAPPQVPVSPRYVVNVEGAKTEKPERCCKIVGPRQCIQTKAFPFSKCFHYRKQHCGDICRTSIMHAEPHEVCDQVETGNPICHQQIAYIPQPQPRCSYTSAWPYVSCGIKQPNCGGCYKHVVQGGSPPNHCSPSCYDQGVNVGPVYQQGPTYQQGYPQAPICSYMGNCEGNPYPGAFGGGGYSQQFENPMDNQAQIETDFEYGQNGISEHDVQNII